LDERVEKKTRKTEIERLKEELRQKDEFNAGMTDIFHSSPRLSRPDTVPNTPSKSAEKSSAEPGDGFVDWEIELDEILTQLVHFVEVATGLILGQNGINEDPTFLGQKLLFQASESGDEAVVQVLLSRDKAILRLLLGRDNVGADKALVIAAIRGHEAVVRLLLERNVVGMESREVAIRMATKGEHEAVVRLLREYQERS
jgi:hypothetical protein